MKGCDRSTTRWWQCSATAGAGYALACLTHGDLERPCTSVIAPAWGEETHTGGECLRVLLEECSSHRRYAERDVAVLEARLPTSPALTGD